MSDTTARQVNRDLGGQETDWPTDRWEASHASNTHKDKTRRRLGTKSKTPLNTCQPAEHCFQHIYIYLGMFVNNPWETLTAFMHTAWPTAAVATPCRAHSTYLCRTVWRWPARQINTSSETNYWWNHHWPHHRPLLTIASAESSAAEHCWAVPSRAYRRCGVARATGHKATFRGCSCHRRERKERRPPVSTRHTSTMWGRQKRQRTAHPALLSAGQYSVSETQLMWCSSEYRGHRRSGGLDSFTGTVDRGRVMARVKLCGHFTLSSLGVVTVHPFSTSRLETD